MTVGFINGKLQDEVYPVTYTSPDESRAMSIP
jgi:hypothetical protein